MSSSKTTGTVNFSLVSSKRKTSKKGKNKNKNIDSEPDNVDNEDILSSGSKDDRTTTAAKKKQQNFLRRAFLGETQEDIDRQNALENKRKSDEEGGDPLIIPLPNGGIRKDKPLLMQQNNEQEEEAKQQGEVEEISQSHEKIKVEEVPSSSSLSSTKKDTEESSSNVPLMNHAAEDISATSTAYIQVPISEFGAAMLRGMGWKKDKDNENNSPSEPQAPRHSRLGLGATPAAITEKDMKQVLLINSKINNDKDSSSASNSNRMNILQKTLQKTQEKAKKLKNKSKDTILKELQSKIQIGSIVWIDENENNMIKREVSKRRRAKMIRTLGFGLNQYLVQYELDEGDDEKEYDQSLSQSTENNETTTNSKNNQYVSVSRQNVTLETADNLQKNPFRSPPSLMEQTKNNNIIDNKDNASSSITTKPKEKSSENVKEKEKHVTKDIVMKESPVSPPERTTYSNSSSRDHDENHDNRHDHYHHRRDRDRDHQRRTRDRSRSLDSYDNKESSRDHKRYKKDRKRSDRDHDRKSRDRERSSRSSRSRHHDSSYYRGEKDRDDERKRSSRKDRDNKKSSRVSRRRDSDYSSDSSRSSTSSNMSIEDEYYRRNGNSKRSSSSRRDREQEKRKRKKESYKRKRSRSPSLTTKREDENNHDSNHNDKAQYIPHMRVRLKDSSKIPSKYIHKKALILDIANISSSSTAKKEKYTLQIVDSNSRTSSKTEILKNISQQYLETALPKVGGIAIVLFPKPHRYSHCKGKLLEKNLQKDYAMLQMLDDDSIFKVGLDYVAEWCGEDLHHLV